MLTKLRVRFAREEGQTMAEYAVVLTVITITTVALFLTLSGAIEQAIATVTAIF